MMASPNYEARLVATEIAIDALLAELEDLRVRLDSHHRICPMAPTEIDLS